MDCPPLALTVLLIGTALAGCATFPALDAAVGDEVMALPFPEIAPLDALLAGDAAGTPADAAMLAARADALRRRADALRAAPAG